MEEMERVPPEEGLEPRQTGQAEQRELDDLTQDPRNHVEQSGDYQQAESIQESLTSLVENAGDLAVIPPPILDGAFMPPPVTNYSVKPQPEDGTIKGSQSTIRGDLDQVAVKGTDSPGGIEATPIPLPGVLGQAVEEGHPPMPQDYEAGPQSDETEAEWLERLAAGRTLAGIEEQDTVLGSLPSIRGDLDQVTVASGADHGGNEATPIPLPGQEGVAASPAPALSESAGQPEKPVQEANHGKPILHQELEYLDSGLNGLDDLDSLVPGPGGKILGAPDGPGWDGNLLGEELGANSLLGGKLPGFEDGPDSLINDAMQKSDPHEPLPGMNSPFLPGHGPHGGMETQEGGKKKPPAGSPQTGTDSKDKNKQKESKEDVKVEATYYTARAVRQLEMDATNAHNQHDYQQYDATMSLLDKIYNMEEMAITAVSFGSRRVARVRIQTKLRMGRAEVTVTWPGKMRMLALVLGMMLTQATSRTIPKTISGAVRAGAC